MSRTQRSEPQGVGAKVKQTDSQCVRPARARLFRKSKAGVPNARAVAPSEQDRAIPEETAIAFTYDRTTFAVMMASPCDLEDFAIGFSLTERVIRRPEEISSLEITGLDRGLELRMSLAGSRAEELDARRRRLAGPAGCGLCGIESLAAATAPPAKVSSDFRVSASLIFEALHALGGHQRLNARTHAVHAAGFWSLERRTFVFVREDVGRHNALDKLIGALSRAACDPASGFVVMTSRISIELVQKLAAFGCPILVAISAPTALAVREADTAGVTLAAVARDDSFEVFTNMERIVP
jgi:FdhD protein